MSSNPPEMTEAEEQLAAGWTNACWDQWSPHGIPVITQSLGPVGEYERRILEAGWKLGFAYCLGLGAAVHIQHGGQRLP